MVQLANPKAAVFMVAFYPQFVPADRPLLATTALLAALQVTLELVLYSRSRRVSAGRAGGSAGRPYDGGSRSSAAPCSSPSASGWPPATEPYPGNAPSATVAPVAASRWW